MEKRKIIGITTLEHPVHVNWLKSVNSLIIRSIYNKKLHRIVQNSFGYKFPLLSNSFFELAKQLYKPIVTSSIIKNISETSIVIGEGGWALPYLSYVKRNKKDIITVLISGDPTFYNLYQRPLFGKFYKNELKDIDYIIATSNFVKKFAKRFFNEDRIRIVYPYPVNTCIQNNNANIDAIVKRIIAKKNNNKIISYVGAFERIKGFDILLKTFETLIKDFEPKVKLYLAGDGPMRFLLKTYLKKYKEKIKYFGYINPTSIYEKTMVYVHLSRFDAFPVSVVEAVMCGNFPIVSLNNGCIDFLKNNLPHHYIIKNNNIIDIAKSINDALNITLEEKKAIVEKMYGSFVKNTNKIFSIYSFEKTISEIIRDVKK